MFRFAQSLVTMNQVMNHLQQLGIYPCCSKQEDIWFIEERALEWAIRKREEMSEWKCVRVTVHLDLPYNRSYVNEYRREKLKDIVIDHVYPEVVAWRIYRLSAEPTLPWVAIYEYCNDLIPYITREEIILQRCAYNNACMAKGVSYRCGHPDCVMKNWVVDREIEHDLCREKLAYFLWCRWVRVRFLHALVKGVM